MDCATITSISTRAFGASAGCPARARVPRGAIRMEDVNMSSQPWRPRRYADGKPRPLFRGVLHGVGSIAFIVGAVVAAIRGDVGLCLGLIGKVATYSASAIFHLYPFKSVVGVTNAFIIDLIFITIPL